MFVIKSRILQVDNDREDPKIPTESVWVLVNLIFIAGREFVSSSQHEFVYRITYAIFILSL